MTNCQQRSLFLGPKGGRCTQIWMYIYFRNKIVWLTICGNFQKSQKSICHCSMWTRKQKHNMFCLQIFGLPSVFLLKNSSLHFAGSKGLTFLFVIILFIYLMTSKNTRKNKRTMTKWQCRWTKRGTNKDTKCTGLQITMPHAPVFSLWPCRGYLAKSEVLPHVRDSNQRWLTNTGGFGSYSGTACAFDIHLYLTPLVQARQFIENCGT